MNASDEKFESDSPSNSLNELLTESVENKKNSDSNFDETLVIKKPVVLKKQMVKQMVKPHSSTRLPVIQKKEISKTRAIKNSSLIPVLPAESEKTHEVLLAEKISPLVEKEEITPAKEVKTAKQILEEKRIEKFHKASQNFSDQVNTLSFRDSRRHHAQNILHKIPNTPENIELLDIMMKDAPVDVQRYIQAKKMKILRNTGEK